MSEDLTPQPRQGPIKAPIEFFAGLFLVALAALSFYGTIKLNIGDLSRMGPGMMPAIAGGGMALFGAALIAESFIAEGPAPERWDWRGIVFVFGAVIVFSLTIRGLGLAVAGPLAVLISSLADRETRLLEIIPFAIALTIVSILLFKTLLGLPIPLWPALSDF